MGTPDEAIISGSQVFARRATSLEAYAAAGCGTATCSPVWTLSFPNGISSIAAANGPVLITSGSELVAVDRQGFVLWRAPLAAPGAVAVTNAGTAFVNVRSTGTTPAQLAAFDTNGCGQAECDPLWTADLPGTGGVTPAAAGGVVYMGTSAGVQAFDAAGCGAATCAALATVTAGPVGNLVVGDGHVLVTGNGQLTALGLS